MNMMDDDRVRHILDLLEIHYKLDTPDDFNELIDRIEVIM